jgi:hypothetical protein
MVGLRESKHFWVKDRSEQQHLGAYNGPIHQHSQHGQSFRLSALKQPSDPEQQAHQ